MFAGKIERARGTAAEPVEMVILVEDFATDPRLSSVGACQAETVGPDRDDALGIEGEHVEKGVGQAFALPLFLPSPSRIGGRQDQGVVPHGPTVRAVRCKGHAGEGGRFAGNRGLPGQSVVRGAENGPALADDDNGAAGHGAV